MLPIRNVVSVPCHIFFHKAELVRTNPEITLLYIQRDYKPAPYCVCLYMRMTRQSLDNVHFGATATGCPAIRPAEDAWVKQDEMTATVKCNRTDETWFLTCNGRQWKGDIGNCTSECSLFASTLSPFGNGADRIYIYIYIYIYMLIDVVVSRSPDDERYYVYLFATKAERKRTNTS